MSIVETIAAKSATKNIKYIFLATCYENGIFIKFEVILQILCILVGIFLDENLPDCDKTFLV